MQSIVRYRTLAVLAGYGAASKRELARFTGCKLPAVSSCLAAMVTSGLAARSGQRHYTITHQGRAALARHITQRAKDRAA